MACPGQVVVLLHDSSCLLIGHGLALVASLKVALMRFPSADHVLQFACAFQYFIWLGDKALIKRLDYDIGVLIIRVITHANNLLLVSRATGSESGVIVVFRLLSLALMHRVPIDSIAAVRRVYPRRPYLLLLFLLLGKKDVLSEVTGSRISPFRVEVLRLQVRHDVSCRG